MPRDDEEDLYDEEFDYVDDEEQEEEDGAGHETDRDDDDADRRDEESSDERDEARSDLDEADEPVDEYGRPEPAANYVVHIYEHKKFKRTIERPFTPEDAEAFATEFNRTSKSYGRFALTGKNDTKPKKALDEK